MSNRQHLFRGKRKDGGGWREGYYAKIGDLDVIIGLDGQYHGIIPKTVGEYTGLTDNNGRKIFEGDIVIIIGEDEIGIVEWDYDDVKFVVIVDNICSDFSHFYGHNLEIIGNVHDNPERSEVTAHA